MAHRLSDAERLLRGLSLVLTEAVRVMAPEARVRVTHFTRHAREIINLAPTLPSAISEARRASPSAPSDDIAWRLRDSAPPEQAEVPVEPSVVNESQLRVESAELVAPPPPAASSADPPPSEPAPPSRVSLLDAPGLPAPRIPASAVPLPPTKRRRFRELSVPASPLARLWGFGGLAASLVAGAAGEALGGAFGSGGSSSSRPTSSTRADAGASPAAAARPSSGGGGGFSAAQAERLAEGLCRMRGAALKLGQMLSLADESLLPPAVAAALERVRAQADVMPPRQLEAVMRAELGEQWRERLGGEGFDPSPVAAASIGQVHRAVLPDGRAVAVKVQYPGVADSINSDLGNLRRLLVFGDFLPRGLYLDNIIDVAREELAAECDYVREAQSQERFRELLAGDLAISVPAVVPELSTKRVLVTTWLDGMPIDQVISADLPQEVRDHIARTLLRVTLKELFVWRFMQTDPNWGNFFYDPGRGTVGLLDFGAAREYDKAFVDDYLRLVWAAANDDRRTIEAVSVRLGFLTGLEDAAMLEAHVASGLVVGEPFRAAGAFDFKASGITARVVQYGSVFAEHRLTPPPTEVYSLHRKLAGAFLMCIRLGARIHCRDLLEELWETYQWGPAAGGGAAAAAGAQEARSGGSGEAAQV